MSLIAINPLECPDWNSRYLGQGPDTFFCTAEWARVLHETYGFTPQYVVGSSAGEAVPPLVLPMMDVRSWLTGRRGVGLPFSDHCEPGGGAGPAAGGLIDFLKGMGAGRGWRYFEIRGAGWCPEGIPSSAMYWRHDLDLTAGETALFERLESSVRTSIRKAVKEGVETTDSASLDAVREFYRLHCKTRRRHGLPPQPYAFFKSLHRNVIAAGKGRVVVARHQGRAIAASVFCHHGRQAVYKYGASDARFQSLRGANVVMWEAIRRYAADGFERFSMGRTALAHAGLRRFKLGWGSLESELRYIRYDFRAREFVERTEQDAETGYRIARIWPIFCLRTAGALLYKHMA